MARADSTIRVNIVGDAKGLSKELKTADKGIAGLASSTKALIGGAALAGAAVAVTDFAQTALAEADRLGDASKRLELQIGDLSSQLVDSAENFAKLGLSAQDVLELEAAFADTATAIGLADEDIARFADDAAATAGALALITDLEPDQAIDLIGKAADGSEKAMKALGISVTDAEIAARAMADTGKTNADALTQQELAAAAYSLVLEALKPRLDEVANGTGDVEQRQAELEARFETLTAKIGAGIEGPLNDLLGWILAGIDGWERFGEFVNLVEGNIRDLLGPIATANQALQDLINTFRKATGLGIGDIPSQSGGSVSLQNPGGGGGGNVNIVVQPNAHDDVERSVVNALRDHNRRNGIL